MNYKEIKKLSEISHEEWDKIQKNFCKIDLKTDIKKEEYEKDLLDIKEILNKHDIEFWLIFGTLLGAIRDNDFLAWDDNINIAVYEEDFLPKIYDIKESFIEKGFIFRIIPKKIGTKINLHRFKHKNSLEALFLDENYKNNRYRLSNSFKHPRKYFEEYGTIKFKGGIFRVPSPAEKYLSFLYKDWKTPISLKKLEKPEGWRNKNSYKKK